MSELSDKLEEWFELLAKKLVGNTQSTADEWHWLTKDPNDLPKIGSTVITYWRNANAKGVSVFDYDYLDHCDEYGNFCEGDYVGFIEQSGYVRLPLDSTRNPIKAWRYLPAIPEEEVE